MEGRMTCDDVSSCDGPMKGICFFCFFKKRYEVDVVRLLESFLRNTDVCGWRFLPPRNAFRTGTGECKRLQSEVDLLD